VRLDQGVVLGSGQSDEEAGVGPVGDGPPWVSRSGPLGPASLAGITPVAV